MNRKNTPRTAVVTAADPLELLQACGEPRVSSRQLALALGNTHVAVMSLIVKYEKGLETLNHLTFQMWDGSRRQGGGKAERVALLSEDQAFFLLALSRNTKRVVELKAKLVQAFATARRNAAQRQTEYLPEYHHLHDRIKELAGGSEKERYLHMNVNRLVNKVAGIEAGQRNTVPLAMLTVANHVAALAMEGASDHRDGYQRAKVALSALAGFLIPQAKGPTHGR